MDSLKGWLELAVLIAVGAVVLAGVAALGGHDFGSQLLSTLVGRYSVRNGTRYALV